MGTDELIEPHISSSPTDEIHRVADAATATVRKDLPMDRGRNTELQEQAANVVCQSAGRCRVVDRQSLAMNAAIALEQLCDEDRDGIAIPAVDDHRDPLIDSDLSLETTVSEEEFDGLRRSRPIDADRSYRRGLGARAMFDPGNRVGERRDGQAHVLEFVRDRRVQIKVAVVSEASFRYGVAEQGGQMPWHRRRSAGELTSDGDKVVGSDILCVHPPSWGEDRVIGRAP